MTPYFQFPQSPENMITLTKITAADNRAAHDMDGVDRLRQLGAGWPPSSPTGPDCPGDREL
jgi:hypothetical protein